MDLHLNLLRQQQQYLLLLNQQRGYNVNVNVNQRFKQPPILGNLPPKQPLINPLIPPQIPPNLKPNLQNLMQSKLVSKNIMPQNTAPKINQLNQLNPHTHPHHHHHRPTQATQHTIHHPHQHQTQHQAQHQTQHQAQNKAQNHVQHQVQHQVPHMAHHNPQHNHLISQHTKHHNHNHNMHNSNQNNHQTHQTTHHNNQQTHQTTHHNNQHSTYYHTIAQQHIDALNNKNNNNNTNKMTNHHSNNHNSNNIISHLNNITSNLNKNSTIIHSSTAKNLVTNNTKNYTTNNTTKHAVGSVKPTITPGATLTNHNTNNNALGNHNITLNQSARYSKAHLPTYKIDATERFDIPKISTKNIVNQPTSIITDTFTPRAPLKRPYAPDNDDKKINGVYKLLNGAITGKIRSPSNINSSTPYSENLKPAISTKNYFNDNLDEISNAFSSDSESIRGNDYGSCKVRRHNYFDDNYALKMSDQDTTKNSSYFDDDTLEGIENYKIAESTRKSVVYPQLSMKNALRPSNTISNLNNSSFLNKSLSKSLAKSQTGKIANKFVNYNANYKENQPGIRRFGVINEKNLNKFNPNHSQNSTLDQIESYRPSYATSGYSNAHIRKYY